MNDFTKLILSLIVVALLFFCFMIWFTRWIFVPNDDYAKGELASIICFNRIAPICGPGYSCHDCWVKPVLGGFEAIDNETGTKLFITGNCVVRYKKEKTEKTEKKEEVK